MKKAAYFSEKHFFSKKSREKFCEFEKPSYLCTRKQETRAFSSVGLEHLPYKQRVGGSNPSTPTGVVPAVNSGSPDNCGIFLCCHF